MGADPDTCCTEEKRTKPCVSRKTQEVKKNSGMTGTSHTKDFFLLSPAHAHIDLCRQQ